MIYKIRHIPSGLYYKAAGERHENLSKRGKLYDQKPNISKKLHQANDPAHEGKYYIQTYQKLPGVVPSKYGGHYILYVKLEDFKLIELVEKETE